MSKNFLVRHTRTLTVIFCLCCVAGCSSTHAPAPVVGLTYDSGLAKYHEVKRGETLFSIAWYYDKDFRNLAELNDLSRPYLLLPGEKLQIKGEPKKKKNVAPPSKKHASKVSKKPTKRTKAKQYASKPSQKQYSKNRKISWGWPTQGEIIRTFSLKKGHKGIDINGKLGQPVRSVADGKVVYSGNGLLRYGNLVIIKHNDDYLSAYAHNDKLLVGEGQWVRQDEIIARMGKAANDTVKLHFELRYQGNPKDPLRYLNKHHSRQDSRK